MAGRGSMGGSATPIEKRKITIQKFKEAAPSVRYSKSKPSVQMMAGEDFGKVSRSHGFGIKFEEFCIKNEELCIKNEEFCKEWAKFNNIDGRNSDGIRLVKVMDLLFKTRNFVLKTRNFVSKTRNSVFKMMNSAVRRSSFRCGRRRRRAMDLAAGGSAAEARRAKQWYLPRYSAPTMYSTCTSTPHHNLIS